MIRNVDPSSAEYARDYSAGFRTGRKYSEGALERADDRGVSHAWYDGYDDAAAGLPKWTSREKRMHDTPSGEKQ